jgi:MoaA/NifB/PqqE/SkfB family radical SAM enzyme
VVPEPLGVYIEPTNICTLKCAGCARTTFIEQWPQHWKNYSIDVDLVMQFLDIDLNNKKVLLSGNYGDPIYHPDFIDLVAQLKQRGARLEITTNGSYRKTDWWQELIQYFTPEDSIIFSIDGVPENFTEYRQNADWSSIMLGIEACVASPAGVAWKYIPFDYNQNNIEQARQLSQELGFDGFFVDPSKRFDDAATRDLKPNEHLVNLEYESRLDWKQNNSGPVDAKCRNGQEHFITADGYYSPCCFVADHRWYYKTQFGKHKNQYSIANHTLSAILAQTTVVEFYKHIPEQPVCQFSCPKLAG